MWLSDGRHMRSVSHHRRTTGTGHWFVSHVVLLASQLGALMVMRDTFATAAGDPRRVVLVELARPPCCRLHLVLDATRQRPTPPLAVPLAATWVAEVALLGTVLHCPDDSTSHRVVGDEIFVLIQAAV